MRRDLQILDNLIPLQLSMNLIIMIVFIPWYSCVLIPMIIAFYNFCKLSTPTLRDLKILEGIKGSPIYNIFSEVISGLETICTHRMKKYPVNKLEKQIEFTMIFRKTCLLQSVMQ